MVRFSEFSETLPMPLDFVGLLSCPSWILSFGRCDGGLCRRCSILTYLASLLVVVAVVAVGADAGVVCTLAGEWATGQR